MADSGKLFGHFLRKLRKERGLTLQALARRVRRPDGRPITAAYLSLIEGGRKPPPRQPILVAIAKALGVIPEKIEAAARGKLHRSIVELLEGQAQNAALVAHLKSGTFELDDLPNLLDAVKKTAPGASVVIRVSREGATYVWAQEDLRLGDPG